MITLKCYDIFPKVLFDLGFIQIHSYGVLAGIGLLFAFFVVKHLNDVKQNFTSDELFDIIFYAFLGGIIGARLFYVLFYNLEFYLQNSLQIFAIHKGGLSVHGGILGGSIATLIYARRKYYFFLDLADVLAPSLALALAVGRIGNLINGELIGRETDFPLGCNYGDGLHRWIYQPIDSFKNFCIFLVLFYLYKNFDFRRGVISAFFLIMIGSFRFLTEFIRQPDENLGFIIASFSMGQILAFSTVCLGIMILIFIYIFKYDIIIRNINKK
jgi:phosphatidylglycerol:prolipoprotein diacylglycerol transferase